MPDDVVPKSQRAGSADSRTREALANLRSDLAYLRRQQHELRCRFHGELAVLALRIEDNERQSMRRRKVARRWAVVALVAAWLWLSRGAVLEMLGGSPVLLPGLIVVVMTLLAGITVVVLFLHNAADEQEHRDRHQNWFRLTERD